MLLVYLVTLVTTVTMGAKNCALTQELEKVFKFIFGTNILCDNMY